MNAEYIIATDAVITDLDNLVELEHDGRKGMKWYKHKYGEWQSHAVYANGQPDPNAKEQDKSKVERNTRKVLKDSRDEKPKEGSKIVKAAKAIKKTVDEAKEKSEAKAKEKAKKTNLERARAAKQAKAMQKAELEGNKRDWEKDPNKLREHLFEFSDEELERAFKRYDWDAKVDELNEKKLAHGNKIVRTYLDYADTAIRGYNTFASVANAVNTARASINGEQVKFKFPTVSKGDGNKQKGGNQQSSVLESILSAVATETVKTMNKTAQENAKEIEKQKSAPKQQDVKSQKPVKKDNNKKSKKK